MSVTIRIHITKEILEKSSRCTNDKLGSNCAFALAVRDILPNAFVGGSTITPYPILGTCHHPNLGTVVIITGQTFITSSNMIAFIRWFDRATPGARMVHDECSFELEIPDWVIERIDIQDIIKSPTLELV